MRARWNIVDYALDEHLGRRLGRPPTAPPRPPTKRWRGRSRSWGSPTLRDEHRAELLDFAAARSRHWSIADWQQGPYRAMRQNALLQLIGVSPDLILQ